MKKLLWTWRFHLQEAGLQGWLGIGMLFGAVGLALVLLLPQNMEARRLEREAMRLRMQAGRFHEAVDRTPASALEVFYKTLPHEHQVGHEVARIFEIAEANDILLQRVEYTLMREPDSALSRYQVELPLRGAYIDIRMFMIDVLNQMPAVAINELAFRREGADNPEVEARLRLTIYLAQRA